MASDPKMATVQEKIVCVLWFFEAKSVIKMQRRYRTQYGKDPHSDNAIRRWLKQLQEAVEFCIEQEQEDQALRRKMLIETRKLRHFTCH
jgi:hypothetical protein